MTYRETTYFLQEFNYDKMCWEDIYYSESVTLIRLFILQKGINPHEVRVVKKQSYCEIYTQQI